jgi:hypothetical protein
MRNYTFNNEVASLAADSWYNMWIVFDNKNDEVDVYLKLDDGSFSDATVSDRVADDYGFRNTADSLITSVRFRNNEDGHTTAAYFDDIYLDFNNSNLLNPIPEPGSLVLLLGGMGMLLLSRRRSLIARRPLVTVEGTSTKAAAEGTGGLSNDLAEYSRKVIRIRVTTAPGNDGDGSRLGEQQLTRLADAALFQIFPRRQSEVAHETPCKVIAALPDPLSQVCDSQRLVQIYGDPIRQVKQLPIRLGNRPIAHRAANPGQQRPGGRGVAERIPIGAPGAFVMDLPQGLNAGVFRRQLDDRTGSLHGFPGEPQSRLSRDAAVEKFPATTSSREPIPVVVRGVD